MPSNRSLDPISLQYFVTVCEEGSIARAAERQALVASALSKRISALEADLGITLLVRRRSGIEPTPAGQALLVGARSLLQQHQRLRAELAEFGQGVQGSIRVLASASALAEQLPDDVAGFLDQHPRLRVSLDEAISMEITRAVLEGGADLGVLWDQGDLSGLSVAPYRSDHLCLAMAPQHPLARRNALRLADVLDEPMVGVISAGRLGRLLDQQAALLGRALVYRLQVSSLDTACRIVSAGLGLAILPREAVAPHAGAGQLALVPLDEAWAQRRFVIVSREGAALSGSVKLLVGHLLHRAGAPARTTAPA